ncbi:MAG: hypothetical protein H7228_07065 [Polaromonas sp.]|nr:hypothetical protein [Polaromonas sp.]
MTYKYKKSNFTIVSHDQVSADLRLRFIWLNMLPAQQVRAQEAIKNVALKTRPKMALKFDLVNDKSRQTLSNRLLNNSEIPRLQRRAREVPPLVFAAGPDRNGFRVMAYATSRLSQKAIA